MKHSLLNIILFTICQFFVVNLFSQESPWLSTNIFKTDYLIENNGQFDLIQTHVKNVLYAVQHQGDEIYFNKQGFSIRLGKASQLDDHPSDHERHDDKNSVVTEWVDMVWHKSNPNVTIETSNRSTHYFSYGDEKFKSFGFKTIKYKNLFDGIDVLYQIHPKGGIEYTLIIHPGGDLNKVRFAYEGNSVSVSKTEKGLLINNKVKALAECELSAYYENGDKVDIDYELSENLISFKSKTPLDPRRKLIIDPWVTSITTLTGALAPYDQTAYHIEYDAAGNLFAFGGGGAAGLTATDLIKVAKYDATGSLQYTFMGIVLSISWNTGGTNFIIGNFTVDKLNGKVYISQGYDGITGPSIVRLNSAGFYDNFISIPNNQFNELWELKLDCNSGKLMAFCGSTFSNYQLSNIDTITGISSDMNLTGIGGYYQDVVNAAISPDNEFYLIFSSGTTSFVNNRIFKLNASNTAPLWDVPSGYFNLNESFNMPYTNALTNAFNCLAANSNYLFYYDGKELKCFDGSNGSTVGLPYTIPGVSNPRKAGGIYANECNEVFVGGEDGNVLKFKFDGVNFTFLSSLIISGQAGKNVYDLSYHPIRKLLYVTGQGFVSALDAQSTCPNPSAVILQLEATVACPDSASVRIVNSNPILTYTIIFSDSISGNVLSTFHLPAGQSSLAMHGMSQGVVYKVTVLQSTPCQVISGSAYLSIHCTNIHLCEGQSYILSSGLIVKTAGVYQDTLVNQLGGDSIITIQIHPVFVKDTTVTICEGQTYSLPDGRLVLDAGIYESKFKSIFNCDSLIRTQLVVIPLPSLFLGNDTIICRTDFLILDANVHLPSASYLWQDNTQSATKLINSSGTYYVEVNVEPCPLTRDTIVVGSKDCHCIVSIPNAFSPNGDNHNEIFKPLLNCEKQINNYSFKIYNRWGQAVFTSISEQLGWNGRMKNAKAELGTYMYYLEFTIDGISQKQIYKGTVELLY